jgi:branched-chain amino acid transport system permease protein
MNLTQLAQAVLYGIMNGSGYILFASGIALTFGVMKVMNFAHGELYMIGGMLFFSLTSYAGMGTGAAMLIAILAGGILGFITNRVVIQPVLRVSALAPLLSTIALSFIMLNGSTAVWGAFARLITPSFLMGWVRAGGLVMSYVGIMVLITGISVGIGLHVFLAKAPMGKQMRATVQNLTGAKLVGINTQRVYDYVLIISSALAALGGILLGFIHTASPAMGQPMIILGFVIVVVAGMDNLLGATIMAIVIGITESLLITYAPSEFAESILYMVLIGILLIRPQGIFAKRGE